MKITNESENLTSHFLPDHRNMLWNHLQDREHLLSFIIDKLNQNKRTVITLTEFIQSNYSLHFACSCCNFNSETDSVLNI